MTFFSVLQNYLETKYRLPYEVYLQVFKFVSLEQAANHGASLTEISNIASNALVLPQPVDIPKHAFTNSIIPSSYFWFICHQTLFKYYLIKHSTHLTTTLLYRGRYYENELVALLAQYNRLDLLEILFKTTTIFNSIPSIIDIASKFGHLNIIKTLKNASASKMAIFYAAENGHLDIVKYLHFNRSEGCSKYAIDKACEKNHIDIVKFLDVNRSEGYSKFALEYAAIKGHLNVIKYFYDKGVRHDKVFGHSVRFGHTEIVEYLMRFQTRISKRVFKVAMEMGNNNIIELLSKMNL